MAGRVLGLFTATSPRASVLRYVPNTYKYHKIDDRLPLTTTSTKSELMQVFRDMSVMRRMEMTAENLYRQKLIRGFLHVYNGEEAVVTGIELALTKQDSVITAYRDHCHYLARGGTVRACLAELMGKAEGCAKGKGGSMHMYLRATNFFGGNGIVGAQVPVGTGLAFAHKYKKDGNVAVAYYGDGAANQGQIFEAYNMAALWDLPIIFVCENNHYGMGTAVNRATKATEFYKRGDYIPGIRTDGMNILAVRDTAKYAVEHAKTKGPIILEMDTYRYAGHSMSDPGTSYRSREEREEVRKVRDPIDLVRNYLLEKSWATAEELKQIEKGIRESVEADAEAAKAAPVPDPSELYTDVLLE